MIVHMCVLQKNRSIVDAIIMKTKHAFMQSRLKRLPLRQYVQDDSYVRHILKILFTLIGPLPPRTKSFQRDRYSSDFTGTQTKPSCRRWRLSLVLDVHWHSLPPITSNLSCIFSVLQSYEKIKMIDNDDITL